MCLFLNPVRAQQSRHLAPRNELKLDQSELVNLPLQHLLAMQAMANDMAWSPPMVGGWRLVTFTIRIFSLVQLTWSAGLFARHATAPAAVHREPATSASHVGRGRSRVEALVGAARTRLCVRSRRRCNASLSFFPPRVHKRLPSPPPLEPTLSQCETSRGTQGPRTSGGEPTGHSPDRRPLRPAFVCSASLRPARPSCHERRRQ